MVGPSCSQLAFRKREKTETWEVGRRIDGVEPEVN
jgi:hypothetical protein